MIMLLSWQAVMKSSKRKFHFEPATILRAAAPATLVNPHKLFPNNEKFLTKYLRKSIDRKVNAWHNAFVGEGNKQKEQTMDKAEREKLELFRNELRESGFMTYSRFQSLCGNPDRLSQEFWDSAAKFADDRENGMYWAGNAPTNSQNLSCFI